MFRSPNETLFCVYDLAIAPITFDFMHFAVNCEMARAANNAKYIHFVFVLGPDRTWRMQTPKDGSLTTDEKMWRLKHILEPIARMTPEYAGHSVYLDRNEAAKELAALPGSLIWPPSYHINQPNSAFMLAQVVDIYGQVKEKNEGITPGCLKPCPEAVRLARRWCDKQDVDVDHMVTITVRQSAVEKERNSNLQSWLRFAREISKEGWHPVVMPDTEQVVIHDANDLHDLKVYWPGPVNLDLRVAMYHLAAYNLSHNGGPAALNFFLPGSKYLQWLPIDALPKVIEAEGEEGQERLLGLKKGEDYEFAEGTKKYVWEKATYTKIYKRFNEFVEETRG